MEAALTAMVVKITTRVGRSSTATARAICSQAATRNPTPSTVDSPKCAGASARCTAPAPTSSAATSHCTQPMLDARASAFGDCDSANPAASGRSIVIAIVKPPSPPSAVRTWACDALDACRAPPNVRQDRSPRRRGPGKTSGRRTVSRPILSRCRRGGKAPRVSVRRLRAAFGLGRCRRAGLGESSLPSPGRRARSLAAHLRCRRRPGLEERTSGTAR